MNTNYVIFTDTDTDMTPAIAAEYGYHLISMPYTIDDEEIYPYQDFEVFESKPFYDRLRAGALPKTSAISPVAYREYFEPFFKEGKDILYVQFSEAMSGTFSAMRLALEELKEEYPERTFYSIDTKSISVNALNMLHELGELYKQGKPVEDLLAWAEKEVQKFAIYFFAEDLDFFRRSGRVKALSAFFGNMLGIMPIMTMGSDGVMRACDKAIGLKKVLAKIMAKIDELQEDIGKHRVIIGHCDIPETAKLCEKKLKEKYGEDLNVIITDVNPTAGSHCGPGSLGISFHAKHR